MKMHMPSHMQYVRNRGVSMSVLQMIKGLLIMPIAWLDAYIWAKKSVRQRYFRLQKWSCFFLRYFGYQLTIEGQEHIPDDQAIYFVSNHQGTLDPILIVASCPVPLSFISKKENEKLPVFGKWARNIETIHFDRECREGNVFMLREAARYLKAKKNLLIFPEGTRSKGKAMNAFKVGSLQPAYLGKATIVPITLNNAYCIDDKKNKDKHLKITYGKAIAYEEYKHIKHDEMTQILFHKIQEKIES
ncbi:MAG: 1-acyl-sn-glycerol-3-phosphate acyltransferase [Clostridia bacterium]|nr:1-acyl-sn-glycerol-3-phosphate acyltransferase [Erysipelotrichia bacterium]NCC87581.1 1-acyl-sn-glycerol-3-phosphate acyltransferase [Clostridia bacterium]